MPLPHAPYSYRSDPAVPDFDDTAPAAFMNGACVLCMAGARILDRLDKTGTIRICPVQTDLGRAILAHYDLDPDDPDTWLFLRDGVAYGSMDALIRIGSVTGGPGHLLQILRFLPEPVQGWLYRRLARNRYWMFGRRETCQLPTTRLRARLLE
ncbi:MAG: DCC1-like thiol-disulfide oxidoreductase family protein [Pseudomonadota bacterium]